MTSTCPDASPNKEVAHARKPPTARPSSAPSSQPVQTPAPSTISITAELLAWAAEHTPGLDLAQELKKCLRYCRAHGHRFANWTEAFKNWLEEAYRRRTAGNSSIPAHYQKLLEKFRLTPEEERELHTWHAEQRAARCAPDEEWQTADDQHDGPEARPPAEDGTAPAEHMAKVIRFPGPSNAAGPAAGSPSEGAHRSQALLNAPGVQSADEIDSRVMTLLGLAMKARQAQQLTAEALASLKQRLGQATSEAELDAIAADIPGAGPHEQPGEA
jgi:hypothetical protein